MALLDFSKFNITEANIDEYDYIIGLDFGHGETSASYWKLTKRDRYGNVIVEGSKKPVDLFFDSNDKRKIMSVLFINKKNVMKIGQQALGNNPEAGRLFSRFKAKPSRLLQNECYPLSDRTKLELIQLFIKEVINALKQNNSPKLGGKGILAVGCPSSSDWLANGRDVQYANILQKAAGHDLRVIIMPESRASLIKVYKEKAIFDCNKGVIVFDHGSSTLDATSINFQDNTFIDESIPLGASYIEQNIFEHFIDAAHPKSSVYDYENDVIGLRLSKEAYYSAPDTRVKGSVEFEDECYSKVLTNKMMTNVTHEMEIEYSTDLEPSVKGTWYSLYKDFLQETKEAWKRKYNGSEFDGVVILTGGASRMDFVEELARKIFNRSTIIRDTEPSFCVSRGLGWAASTDIDALKLIIETKEKIAKKLEGNIPLLEERVAKKVSPIVFQYLESKMNTWVDYGEYETLSELIQSTKKSFLNDAGKKTEIQTLVKDVLNNYLNDNSSNGVKNIIVTTVNEVFRDKFPHAIREDVVGYFKINDSKWKNAVEEIFNNKRVDISGSLVDNLDIDGVFVGIVKGLLILVIGLPLYLLGSVVDYLFDTELVDWVDKQFEDNKNKRLNKDKRRKYLANMRTKKSENMTIIENSIKSSCMSDSNKKALIDIVIKNIDPEINNAVDTISLYFSQK